jgi:hypothetical protein
MRLFHVSEEPDIREFLPRIPSRSDLDPAMGLVWALDEGHLPNFLTPRDCPRVTYHAVGSTSPGDMRWFSSPAQRHAVVIESGWFKRMGETTLYLYEFDPAGFALQDASAGYYVSTAAQRPIARHVVGDLFQALFERNVELRVVDNLWSICRKIQGTSLEWSMCRMRNAVPEPGMK